MCEWNKGNVLNQRLQQRRSCWCVCGHRRAELHVQIGNTLYSADMLEKMLNVNVHLTSGQDGMRGVFPPGRGLAVCEQYKKCTIMQ